MSNKTTMRDVAAAAGVSTMAVSAVLHGTGKNVKVSPEKSELIRRVARELRYQPNHVARSLRSRRTHTIGVVLQHFRGIDAENPYHPLLLNGIMEVLFPAGYALSLCPKLVSGSEASSIADGRFDGVLWCRPDFTEASVDFLRSSPIPVVMMHAPPGTAPGIPTLCVDNEGALELAVAHLTELGHRRIAFVVDPISMASVEGNARAEAYRAAMGRRGLPPAVEVWSSEVALLEDLLRDGPEHTAMVCYSDFQAGRLLQACDRMGIHVPERLSVIGFDSSSFCENTKPRLTSLRQPVQEIACGACRVLVDLIESEAPLPEFSRTFDSGLDLRNSTGKVWNS
jgi:LacI family transcriptional regulator